VSYIKHSRQQCQSEPLAGREVRRRFQLTPASPVRSLALAAAERGRGADKGCTWKALIAVEFMRRNRRDVTDTVYAGADHSFTGFERRLVTAVFEWILATPGGSAPATANMPGRTS